METCLCKLHDNLGFVAQKLFSMKLLNTPELETLMAEICCDQTNKECMYNDCGKYKEKEFTLLRKYEGSTQVAYMQWVTEDTKGQTKDNTETTFKKTVKKKVETMLDDLIELFNNMLVKFKCHAFNIRQQYRYSRELKRNMAENECIIHVDFSENYICTVNMHLRSRRCTLGWASNAAHWSFICRTRCWASLLQYHLTITTEGAPSHMGTSNPHSVLCQEPLPCCHSGPFPQRWTLHTVPLEGELLPLHLPPPRKGIPSWDVEFLWGQP